MGAIALSYAYTSATLVVCDNTKKFLPKQQVSAFVSASLVAKVPGEASLKRIPFVDDSLITLRFVLIVCIVTDLAASHLRSI